ncbi:hypothetical protein PG997_003818 [Apiospora hydei]|uniref:Uncharacterized protein n=1 Tax=Apiospora hydei TaxID=1337664 RepID=A0ABR1X0D9_9PEZI
MARRRQEDVLLVHAYHDVRLGRPGLLDHRVRNDPYAHVVQRDDGDDGGDGEEGRMRMMGISWGRAMSLFRRLSWWVSHGLRRFFVIGSTFINVVVAVLFLSTRLMASPTARMSRSPVVWLVKAPSIRQWASPKGRPRGYAEPRGLRKERLTRKAERDLRQRQRHV